MSRFNIRRITAENVHIGDSNAGDSEKADSFAPNQQNIFVENVEKEDDSKI